MNLTDTVYGRGTRGCRYTECRFAMLLARKGDSCAVDCVTAYDIKYLCILLTGRLESPLTGRYIIKQIFDLLHNEPTGRNEGSDKFTVICVPPRPAVGLGSGLWPGFGGVSRPSA